MGAAAGAVVGQVVVGALVGMAAQKVSQSLGMPDMVSNMIGMGAGIAAGGMVTGAAGTAAGVSPAAAGVPMTPGGSTAVAPPSQLPTTTPPQVSNVAGTPIAPDASPHKARGGMLSQKPPQIATPPSSAPPATVGGPQGTTADRAIAAGTGGDMKASPTWVERLFTPEKTMDMVMAGMQGYAQSDQRKWELERDYEREDEISKRWKDQDSDPRSLKPTYPTQDYGSY